MFHISNLGPNALAAQFADINGYVPEAGDNWRDMNFDFGTDCPKRWKRKVEEAQDEFNDISDKWHCADEDEAEELEQAYEEALDALEAAKYELDTITQCLDEEWWPYLVRDAIAATAEDNAELAAN